LHAIARANFSTEEFALFASAHVAAQVELFHRLWSAKEAYIKARGGGLSIPLQDFSIDVSDPSVPWSVRTRTPSSTRWRVEPVPLPPGYAGALAIEGDDALLRRVLDLWVE
jgi:4'-phosphopantetheinyl transferase